MRSVAVAIFNDDDMFLKANANRVFTDILKHRSLGSNLMMIICCLKLRQL